MNNNTICPPPSQGGAGGGSFDLIIIGAGPGGYEVAVEAAHKGLQVLVIEKQALGGTCLNEGCIPTKCLCHSAEVLDEVREAAVLGINAGEVTFDINAAMTRKDAVLDGLRAGIAGLMKTPGITFVEGEARFAPGDAHTVFITPTDGSDLPPHLQGGVRGGSLFIAVGSVTKFLPIPGNHSSRVVTSKEMLQLDRVPQRLVIIGGGVIGLEFAGIYNSFGSEVTVVEYCKEILPAFDRDLAKRLRTSLKKKGITFVTGAAVTAIEDGAESSTVIYDAKGKEGRVEADVILMAVGRAANVAALNLEEAGIEFTPRGIIVDENMQTNVPGVYAVGDVNGLCQLAHAATFQSYDALKHVLKTHPEWRGEVTTESNSSSETEVYTPLPAGRGWERVCPAAVFTTPEAAMVGLTEEACEAKGIQYKALKSMYRANGRALSMAAEEGLVKILVATASEAGGTPAEGTILGAHILGAHASDMIHEIAVLMNKEARIADLADMVHAHPSLSEIILAAARG